MSDAPVKLLVMILLPLDKGVINSYCRPPLCETHSTIFTFLFNSGVTKPFLIPLSLLRYRQNYWKPWRFAHDFHQGGPEIPARFVFGCRQRTKAMLLEQKNQKDHRQPCHKQQDRQAYCGGKDRQDTVIDSKGDHDGSLYKLVQSMAP